MDKTVLVEALVAGSAFVVQVIAIIFVARVSRDYHLTLRDVEGIQLAVKAIAAREKRDKLLAEHLYQLASLQARFSQRGMTLLFHLFELTGHEIDLTKVKASFDELADQIETASHEVGIFSNSSEVRNKALRSLAFGKGGPHTAELLDELGRLDLENVDEYEKYKRQLIHGLWNGWYRAESWTG